MSRPRRFTTTRWSLVLAAGQADPGAARLALAELCERYWYPLYAFLRRQGQGEDAALDLVQGFCAQLLERGDLAADASRGRFRSYLIGALKHYAHSSRRREKTEKRGGRVQIGSLQAEAAEARYRLEPVDDLSPEKLFERRWALQVLHQAVERLRAESLDKGKQALFDALEPALVPGGAALDHAATARGLLSSEGAIKVALHRLRRRLGELIRDEVLQTLPDGEGVEDEVGLLLAALSP